MSPACLAYIANVRYCSWCQSCMRPACTSLMRGTPTHLGHLSQCSTFFSEVDDDTAAAILGLLDGLLNAEDEVWPTGADIRAEDIASVALRKSVHVCHNNAGTTTRPSRKDALQ